MTFDVVVRSFKKNGFGSVRIRVSNGSNVGYISTHFLARQEQVANGRVFDMKLLKDIMPVVGKYIDKSNKIDLSNLTMTDIIEYLTTDDERISFTDYADLFILEMKRSGRSNSSDNYTCAVNSLKKFMASENFYFSDITSKLLNMWIKSLSDTHRAKNMYPKAIATIFRAGTLHYNDFDNGIIRIKNQPFIPVKIPPVDASEKRAVDPDQLKKIFSVDTKLLKRKTTGPLALDVAKLVFFLAGINTADLYFMEKDCLKSTYKLIYNRHKTAGKRKDKASMEITVPEEIRPLFDKYKGSERLFSFSDLYNDNDSFNKYLNKGLKEICDLAKVDKITTYSLRHTWGTIAQNNCGASTELVGFCLNHASAHKVTELYIKKDYSKVDILNSEVINFVFS